MATGTVIESPLPEDVDVDWILPINDVKTGQPGLQVSLFRDDIARKRFPTVAFTYIEHAETFYSQLNDTPQPFVFEDGTEAPGLAAITIHNIRRCPLPGESIDQVHGQYISGRTLSEVVHTMLDLTYEWRALRDAHRPDVNFRDSNASSVSLRPATGAAVANSWEHWWASHVKDDFIYFVAVRRTKPDWLGRTYLFPQVELRLP